MTDPRHPASLPVDVLLQGCEIQRQRRSGPGGQHRNKVETAVVITHTASGIQAEASERRSQEQNRREALFRLRVRLAIEVRGAYLAGQSPSGLWQQRCPAEKIRVNTSHDDFPSLLAEAIDAIAGHDWNVAAAAQDLGCTTSQLTKLLKQQPTALELVNRQRAARDLRRLK